MSNLFLAQFGLELPLKWVLSAQRWSRPIEHSLYVEPNLTLWYSHHGSEEGCAQRPGDRPQVNLLLFFIRHFFWLPLILISFWLFIFFKQITVHQNKSIPLLMLAHEARQTVKLFRGSYRSDGRGWNRSLPGFKLPESLQRIFFCTFCRKPFFAWMRHLAPPSALRFVLHHSARQQDWCHLSVQRSLSRAEIHLCKVKM